MIAGGYWQYGMMARNAAMGIRLHSDLPIALFCDDIAVSHFNEYDKSFFTIYPLPDYAIKSNAGTSYYRAKTFLPEFTPFKETVFLDVDLIWHPERKADELFNVESDFTMTNEGYMDFKTLENTITKNYHYWAQPSDIKTAYPEINKEGRLYQYRSEYIYFKKTKEVEKYFKLARTIYDNPKMNAIKFGDVLPDEIAFDTASAIMKFYPEKNNYSPIYWDYLYAFMRLERSDLYKKYYAYSMGGKLVREVQRVLYNDLVKHYHKQYGTKADYLWEDKMHFAKLHQMKMQ